MTKKNATHNISFEKTQTISKVYVSLSRIKNHLTEDKQ